MSPQQAVMVFAQFGVAEAELVSPALLKAARNRLLMQVHSDHTRAGSDADASSVNAAYDVLKQRLAGGAAMIDGAESVLPAGWTERRRARGPAPEWMPERRAPRAAPAFDSAEAARAHVAGLAGDAGEEYLVYYYDGGLRPGVAMPGTPAAFSAMAQAVIALHGRARGFGHRGVLLGRPRSADLLLVNLDGRDLRPPVPFAHDILARSPGDDEKFLRLLPTRLAAIARGQAAYA